jgi:DNA repair exonuclease SbcCD ATPase subunit
MVDWNEVEELLRAGYHPYRFKSGKYEYMALKRGRESRSLGAYDEEAWNRLASLCNIHQYDSKKSMEDEQPAEKPKPEVRVSKEILAHIISELEAGKSRVQIVAEWDYHPDVVNYAYETWLELKEPAQQATTSEVTQLRAQHATLQTQLEALKSQFEETQKRLSDLEKARASIERRGKLLYATCHYARNGKCTEPNVIEALGKSGQPEVDVDEYVCNSCLCYWRFR